MEIAVHLAVACGVYGDVSLCCPFRGVLDEILNLIESVSEEFPSYFFMISTRYNVYNIHKMFFHEYDLSALSDVKFLYKTLDENK